MSTHGLEVTAVLSPPRGCVCGFVFAQWAAVCGVNAVRDSVSRLSRFSTCERSLVGAAALPGAVGVPGLVWRRQQQPLLWG